MKEDLKVPRIPHSFFKWYCKPNRYEELHGDLEEIFYERAEEKGVRHARLHYALDVIRCCQPYAWRKASNTNPYNPYIMYRNYFIIAWRNLIKKKAYSMINIFGLALGIACCFLIFMYVQQELSFDNYHEKGNRIYRVIHGRNSGGDVSGKPNPYWVWGNAPVGPALGNYFPEVEKVVQFSGRSDVLLKYEDKMFQEDNVFCMDSTAFDVFSWELLQGDPKTALVVPYSIILTESTARKYFGSEDPMGKILKGEGGRVNDGDYKVTGIMAEVPANSHFRFDALISMSSFKQSRAEIFGWWGYVDFYTYFVVNEQFNEENFKAKIPDFIATHHPNPEWNYNIDIEPLKDVYLRTDAERQPGETGSLSNIYVFSVVGMFILAIAIINFMNLSTARAIERGKEVGIRKSIGAARSSLVTQFLSESFLVVILAMVTAIVLVFLALPYMVDFTGKEFSITPYLNLISLLIVVAATLTIGLFAGAYPAFVLSRFEPAAVLKGTLKSNVGGIDLRKILVVFQFSLSIALIAGTIIVYTQMNHILDKDMGFDKERMLILDYNYDGEVNTKTEVLNTAMRAIPAVTSTAFTRSVPGSHFPNAGTEIQNTSGEMEMLGQAIFQVGMDFIPHFDLELVAGRSYSRDFPSDSSSALVLNEAAAKQYGYSNPADIVGKKFSQWGREGEVIGVVKDFNYISLHQKIEPLTLPFSPYDSRYMCLKVKSENLAQTINEIGAIWAELIPHRPFLYSFLDDDFNAQYRSDFIFRKLFTTFSCLAIFIACLGLLGLATYTAEQRTKEIGIRKVLGADVRHIVTLMSRDFVKLVLIAIIIATPLAWYAMGQWLQEFAYRMEISLWIFVLAGCIALFIALLTIGYQSIRSAMVNPVNTLKSE